MNRVIVTFNHKIDSNALYEKFNGELAVYEPGTYIQDKERLDIIDLDSKSYLFTRANLGGVFEVVQKCWEFAPFEIFVGEEKYV